MSKSTFNVRFSDNSGHVNEHEVFEMMRSRNLYQIQFDLNRRLKKRIRSLELDEKMQAAFFQRKKTFFLTKMQEKVKLRNAVVKNHNVDPKEKTKSIKNTEKFSTLQLQDTILSERGQTEIIQTEPLSIDEEKASVDTILPVVDTNDGGLILTRSKECLSYGGRSLEVSKSSAKGRRLNSVPDDFRKGTSSEMVNVNELGSQGNARRSTENVNFDRIVKNISQTSFYDISPTYSRESKQTTKLLPNIGHKTDNGMVTFRSETNIGTLKISPSPRRLPTDKTQLTNIVSMDNSAFRDKKSLATYEMGATTPGGKLLLFKTDHDEYMNKFRLEKRKQLLKSRRHSENLEQKIKSFNISGDLTA